MRFKCPICHTSSTLGELKPAPSQGSARCPGCGEVIAMPETIAPLAPHPIHKATGLDWDAAIGRAIEEKPTPEHQGPSWECDSGNIFARFFATIFKMITAPSPTMAHTTGNYLKGICFGLIATASTYLLGMLIIFSLHQFTGQNAIIPSIVIGNLIANVFGYLVGVFILSSVLHTCLVLLRKATVPFRNTINTMAYVGGLGSILSALFPPFFVALSTGLLLIGRLDMVLIASCIAAGLFIIWFIYIQFESLKSVHQANWWSVLLAIIVQWAIGITLLYYSISFAAMAFE